MKKFIPIFCSFVTVFFVACNKDEIHNTEDQVGISRVTHFPVLTLIGDRYMTVPLGTPFTDPGVTAKEGSSDIAYTTNGTVNTGAVGVYTLTYTAVNKDGFPASVVRTVAVYSTDASAAANDLSGTYLRPATGVNSFWTKLAPGVYKVDNPGGAGAGTGLTVIVFNPTGLTVKAPAQRSNDGNISSTSNETYALTPAPPKYSWVFNNPGYGTSLRTFIKQ